MARPRRIDEDTPFEGKILSLKNFKEALQSMAAERQIPPEKSEQLFLDALVKAYKETRYSTNKVLVKKEDGTEVEQSIAGGIHVDAKFDNDQIRIFLHKDVTNNVIDDLYQIEPEDAKELDPEHKDYHEGDVWTKELGVVTDNMSPEEKEEEEKYSFAKLPHKFYTKVTNYFLAMCKETTKSLLLEKYKDRVGKIVIAVVNGQEGKNTSLLIGGVHTVLTERNAIPGEAFTDGENIKVLLESIGKNPRFKDDKSSASSLNVTRTSKEFLKKLFEEEIPDLADGSIVIKGIARDPGNRSKISVATNNPNVDPTGACIGSDGSRIKSISNELNKERIDIVQYYDNPYLYIAEALKPATVVGVSINEDQVVPENKSPKAIAVVKNEESRIAIGKGGINVRLASQLTGYSIDIKEQDKAMSEHITFKSIDDIRRKLALETLDKESKNIKDDNGDVDLDNIVPHDDEEEEVVDNTQAESLATKEAEEKEQVEKTEAAKVETPKVETPEAKPAKVEEPVEHVEITNKAKVSISELEAQIEEEKKKKGTQANKPSYKKNWKKKDDEEKETTNKTYDKAMPIYTEDELKEMDEEEKNNQEDNDDDEDYSEYDSDKYYQD